MEKIGEIKARFAEAGERLKKASMRTEAESAAGLLENLEQTYREDTRSGVQALIRRSEKQREALEKETARIYQLQQYERDYEKEGLICGIDEVGRGPAGGTGCCRRGYFAEELRNIVSERFQAAFCRKKGTVI